MSDTSAPLTDEQIQELRNALKRCSPETIEAAVRFRQTRDEKEIPAIVYGIIERHMAAETPVRLAAMPDDTELARDLSVDSLTMLEIVLQIEETLGISVDNEELRGIRSLGAIKDFIGRKVSGRGEGDADTTAKGRGYVREEIMAVLPQQPPFLFLDAAHIEEKTVRARYKVRGDEFFLEGHFKDNPVFPATIVFEALGQAACLWILEHAAAKDANAKNDVVFASMEEAHFHRRAKPGDTLEFIVEALRVRAPLAVFSARVEVNGQRVAEVAKLKLAFGPGIADAAERIEDARAERPAAAAAPAAAEAGANSFTPPVATNNSLPTGEPAFSPKLEPATR